MTATRTLDASISKTPLALDGDDLATVCVLCSHNCGVRVDVRAGRISAVRADETSPITSGYICNKAVSIPFYVNHAQRLEHPLRRRADGSFERDRLGHGHRARSPRKLDEIRSAHSPRAIGLVGIGGQGNHMDAPYGLGFLRALGSRRWFNAFAQEKTQHNLMDQWMFDASPATFFHADMANARFLLVLGTNPRISQPRPQSDRELQALRRGPHSPDGGGRPARDGNHPRSPTATCGCARGRTPICCSGWPRRSCETSSSITSSCASRTRDFEILGDALAAVDVDEMARRCWNRRRRLGGDRVGARPRRVGGDLLRPRRRAGAVLDVDLLPHSRPAHADQQRRTARAATSSWRLCCRR